MNRSKKLLALSSLLFISSAAWCNKDVNWPVSITIDPSHIKYNRSEEPVALVCSYLGESHATGKNAPSWVSSTSHEVWIVPSKVNSISFDFKRYERLGKGHVSHQLHCKTVWQKPGSQSFSFMCPNVTPDSTIDLGSALNTGQCILNINH